MDTGFSAREIMRMKRRRFKTGFKEETARMLIVEGLTARELSDQLGVGENLLYKWKHEHLEEMESSKPVESQCSKKVINF